jgi:hypothetical protein
MAAYFAGTLTAFKKGITKMPIAAAIKNIENWEERLQEVELTGCRAILRDLAALKKQLQETEPDGERIRHLMAKLASETVSISEKADPQHGDKIANLGNMLADAAENAGNDGEPEQPAKKAEAAKSSEAMKSNAGAGADDHDADGKFAKGNHAGRLSHTETPDHTTDAVRMAKSDGDGRGPQPRSR